MNRAERYREKHKHPCAECGARVNKASTLCVRCVRKKKAKQLSENPLRLRHGYAKRLPDGRVRPEYYIWASMKARCMNPKMKEFKNYGGRGIEVCKRWRGARGFDNFILDMGPRPAGQHVSGRAFYTIDRKKNDGPYSPGNCVWATYAEQGKRRTTSRVLRLGGRAQTLSDWARERRISLKTIHTRLSRGWSVKDAIMRAERGKENRS